jgi:hypothetical protein
MEQVANIIPVPDSDTERYLVEYEWDSEYEWVVSDLLGFQTTHGEHYNREIHTSDRFFAVYMRIVQSVVPEYYSGGGDKVAEIFSQYLTFSGIPNKVITLQGYSQGEWAKGVVYLSDVAEAMGYKIGYTNEERLEKLISDLESWWRGDVYRVTKQELVTYHTPDGSKTYQRWEEVEDLDALSGITDEVTLEMCQAWIG